MGVWVVSSVWSGPVVEQSEIGPRGWATGVAYGLMSGPPDGFLQKALTNSTAHMRTSLGT